MTDRLDAEASKAVSAALISEEISYSVLVRAAPEQVYDAMATAEGMNGWFTGGSSIDGRPGGKLHLRWQDWGPDEITTEDTGVVLEAVRGDRFTFQWHPDNSSYATTVEMRFEAAKGGTIIRLRERGYHDTPSGRRAMLECAAGWGEALALCKFYVEHGIRY